MSERDGGAWARMGEGTVSDRIVHHAKRWLHGPLPDDLMADLADIVEDEDYSAEKRAHQVVWQALKWMMGEEHSAALAAREDTP